MCSRVADDDDEFVEVDEHRVEVEDAESVALNQQLENKLKLGEGAGCSKCGQPAVVILRAKNVYCTRCLHLSVNHKFRSCLGKSHLMRPSEKVLIAFSGGQSSVAMLHLIKQGLEETSRKKLLFIPLIVYVDECTIFSSPNDEAEDRQRTNEQIACAVKDYEFPFYIVSIEKAMGKSTDLLLDSYSVERSATVTTNDEPETCRLIRDLFESLKSLTSKEDLLNKLRQTLLSNVAHNLDCSKVFLADSESRIAVRVLSDIAQGKGRHLSLACGFVDDRCAEVFVVRPMREILAKEISFYVTSKQLGTVTRPTFTTKQQDGSSIQHLTEKFVFGLQREFPATISTIFRTGDKMAKKGLMKTVDGNSDNCILCMVSNPLLKVPLLDVVADEIRPEVQSSKPLAEKASCSSSCSCSSEKYKLEKSDLRVLMCYSCQIILDEMTCIDVLPSFVSQSASVRLRRSKMKSEIQEYLLEDNDDDVDVTS